MRDMDFDGLARLGITLSTSHRNVSRDPANDRDRTSWGSLLGKAEKGLQDPTTLSASDIRDVCFALIVNYAQMGVADHYGSLNLLTIIRRHLEGDVD